VKNQQRRSAQNWECRKLNVMISQQEVGPKNSTAKSKELTAQGSELGAKGEESKSPSTELGAKGGEPKARCTDLGAKDKELIPPGT